MSILFGNPVVDGWLFIIVIILASIGMSMSFTFIAQDIGSYYRLSYGQLYFK